MSHVASAILTCYCLDEHEEADVLESVNQELSKVFDILSRPAEGFKTIPYEAIGGSHGIGATLMVAGFNHLPSEYIEEAVRNATYPVEKAVMLMVQSEEDEFFNIVLRAIFKDPHKGTIWEANPKLVDAP